MQRIVASLLSFYKIYVSPMLPSACRFYPTCSVYMRDAVQYNGVARGLWLGVKRLARCHPFHEGGFDPAPGSLTVSTAAGAARTESSHG